MYEFIARDYCYDLMEHCNLEQLNKFLLSKSLDVNIFNPCDIIELFMKNQEYELLELFFSSNYYAIEELMDLLILNNQFYFISLLIDDGHYNKICLMIYLVELVQSPLDEFGLKLFKYLTYNHPKLVESHLNYLNDEFIKNNDYPIIMKLNKIIVNKLN